MLVGAGTERGRQGDSEVARRKPRSVPKPRRAAAWLPLAAAYAVGLACLAGGICVLALGEAEPIAGEEAVKGSVTRLGFGLVFLGLIAIALTGYMHRTRRRG